MATPDSAPAHYNYPLGFFSYKVSNIAAGATVTVTAKVPAGTNPSAYIKCNSSAASCAPFSGAAASGDTITLTLVDGGAGDSDGKADGVISDPGAPAVAIPDSTAYYLPFASTSLATGGKDGVFVVPAGAPAAATAPQFVSTDNASRYYAFHKFLTNDAGKIYQEVPNAVLYQVFSGQLYKLDLSGGGVPAPMQVSTLPNLDPNHTVVGTVCASFSDQQDATDPSTGFVLLEYTTSFTNCGSADDDVVLVHLSDSATTLPVAHLPLHLYSNISDLSTAASMAVFHDAAGTLSGVVGVDNKGNLNFYKDLGFSSPKTLLPGVSSFYVFAAGNNYAFLAVSLGSQVSLYRVDSSGAMSTDLHDFLPSIGNNSSGIAPNGRRLYFSDNASTVDSTGHIASYSSRLEQVPLDGSAAAQLVISSSGQAPPNTRLPVQLNILGFSDSKLIFELDASGASGGGAGNPATLYAIPVDADATTSPTIIGSLSNGYWGGIVRAGRLFANVHTFDANRHPLDVSAQVIAADGTVAKTYPKSWFLGAYTTVSGHPASPVYSDATVVLAEGYTDTPPTVGGASVKELAPDSLAESVMNKPDGTPFVPQSGELPALSLIGSPVSGSTTELRNSANDQYDAIILDITNKLWIQVTNTSDTSEGPMS